MNRSDRVISGHRNSIAARNKIIFLRPLRILFQREKSGVDKRHIHFTGNAVVEINGFIKLNDSIPFC